MKAKLTATKEKKDMTLGNERLFQKAQGLVEQYQKETGVQCILFDERFFPLNSGDGNWHCHQYYCQNQNECQQDHELVIREAFRLGNTFIHLCHRNLVLWGLPLIRDGKIVGSAISGYLLFEQNRSQLLEYQNDFPSLDEKNGLVSSKTVSLLSKRLFEYFKSENLIDVDLFREFEEKAHIQRAIGEKLIENKQLNKDESQIIYLKQNNLMSAIKNFDVEEIRDNLNDVLSEIFLEGVANLKLLKFRMLELFVLITRTMLEVGGDFDRFYQLTTDYAKKTESLEDIYSFSLWLKEVLNDFIESVTKHRKKTLPINRAIAYINQNLDRRLSISDVASHVEMSESRFSQVFRQEMGTSFPEYVNSVKIEKAKELIGAGNCSLIEIASSLSFFDQSYFSKTFRKYAGMTPKQYQKKVFRP